MLLTLLAPIGALSALVFCLCYGKAGIEASRGKRPDEKISLAVRRGANAYLRRQYLGVAVFFATLFLILLLLAFFGFLSFFVPFAFLTGGFFFRPFRLYWHENCHLGQCEDGQCSAGRPE